MQRIAVFDFDGTIIHGDSVVNMLTYGRQKGLVSIGQLLYAAAAGALYHLHIIGPMPSKRAAHAFLPKMPDAKREAFLKAFAQTLVDRARPEALQQMSKHRADGELVLICSASGHCYMHYVAEMLQADALLCTPCDAQGLPEGVNCRGEEKVRRVRAWLKETHQEDALLTAGYGDTAGDAPILRQCQTPVLVRPKKKLKKLMPDAIKADWQDIKKR